MTRTVDDAKAAWAQMQPLRPAGYDLMPLTEHRTPWTNWPSEDYSDFDFVGHLVRGGAVGVRLGPHDLIVDVDPRNDGDWSFKCLCWDLDVNLDAPDVPAVRSGGGGLHLYFRKPDIRTRVNLPEQYPGIDFKRRVGYVVAPGSGHPSGGRYSWLRRLGEAPQVPGALLSILAQPRAGIRPEDERLAAGLDIGDPAVILDLEQLCVPDRTRALIAVPAAPGQRSERLRTVILSMIVAGEPNETILGVITDPRWAISESVREKDDEDAYARRQIIRAHAWLRAQREGELPDDDVQ